MNSKSYLFLENKTTKKAMGKKRGKNTFCLTWKHSCMHMRNGWNVSIIRSGPFWPDHSPWHDKSLAKSFTFACLISAQQDSVLM